MNISGKLSVHQLWQHVWPVIHEEVMFTFNATFLHLLQEIKHFFQYPKLDHPMPFSYYLKEEHHFALYPSFSELLYQLSYDFWIYNMKVQLIFFFGYHKLDFNS